MIKEKFGSNPIKSKIARLNTSDFFIRSKRLSDECKSLNIGQSKWKKDFHEEFRAQFTCQLKTHGMSKI